MRYKIIVYADRGSGRPYSYVEYDRLKASKVADALSDTAYDILAHETRGEYKGNIVPYLTGRVIRVYHPDIGSLNRFIVKAWRL